MAAYWQNRSERFEKENVTLIKENATLKKENVTLKSELVEQRGAERKRESAEVEDSARSQRLKRRRGGKPAEEHGRSSTKRANTKAGATAFHDDAVLQNLDEAGFKWDELGW